jgi:hypothetical protein
MDGNHKGRTQALTVPLEIHAHKAFVEWLRLYEKDMPELGLMFHIPNGERRGRKTGYKLKTMGVIPGVSDFFMPVPVKKHHGLWIELKRAGISKSSVSPEEQDWLFKMQKQGYAVRVCYGFESAVETTLTYLKGLWNEV